MNKIRLLHLIVILLFLSCSTRNKLELETSSLRISVDKFGLITQLTEIQSSENFLSGDTIAPLLSVRIENEVLRSLSANFDQSDHIITLYFERDIIARIRFEEKETHISFELISVTRDEEIELVIWGPYPTCISKVIGETVGIAQGETFALGLQALNPKTLGGYPWKENDCMPQINIFEQDDYSDLSEENKSYVLYRVEAAKPTEYGSSFQAYCRNRNRERIVENLNHEKYIAPVYEDGGIIGSKIALFGCPVEITLETIGAIEVAEGLPHPMIHGEWTKLNPAASSAYIILDFGEEDIEKAIGFTKKAGLKYLYHFNPFENWGHFDLKEQFFPNGVVGLKSCVEKAEDEGISVGLHMLSNFITTNDPYVTPIPDKRLAIVGSSIINEDIDDQQTEIPIEDPAFFNQYKNNNLRTVMIGDELIQYDTVSGNAPWKLLGCTRGAFGTNAAVHEAGTKISKLADHGYKVFLTNAELSIEVAKNMADLYNACGLRQISFDGLEGNRSTAMGNYGEVLFTTTWYDNINKNIKRHFIADASRTSHYFWHIYTRMNWGEPWYAGFRESQTSYRLKNQAYFKRNLMPGMLGWFHMKPETIVEDIEWMLALSGIFNAGYAFVVNYSTLDENEHTEKILRLLGEWEEARMSDAFTPAQKQKMEEVSDQMGIENNLY